MPRSVLLFVFFSICMCKVNAQQSGAKNPISYSDIPDLSMIRVRETYYMSSTTMHLSPGLPIMKSTDLVNWEIINYAYDVLDTVPQLDLKDNQNAYGRGSWASSLRYHMGTYYVSTFSATTGKTHIFYTDDIENGPWQTKAFEPSYHDNSLFFDEDGKIYLIWGAGKLMIAELKNDLSGIKPNSEKVLIENATSPAGTNVGLPAEGSQIFKVDGKFYLLNIAWPKDGMRTVIVHRADHIIGPYEGRVVFQDKGVAQGGLIDTPEGNWYTYLFRDYGAVGRIPYLVPVTWKDNWPVLGENGMVPDELDLPMSKGISPSIVASDNFERETDEESFPLVWQWNHNSDSSGWSLHQRKGYLRLTTTRVDTSLLQARNSLTQRTFGPVSTAVIKLDTKGMKDGDIAGLTLLQRDYGFIGVQVENDKNYIVVKLSADGEESESKKVAFDGKELYLKAFCDFRDRTDKGYFYFSLNGENWTRIGDELQMKYTLPHFMGYRFGLFNYASKSIGGNADFDFYEISDEIPDLN